MWTDDPEKSELIKQSDEMVTPEYVADVTTSLIENEKVEANAGLESRARSIAKDVSMGDAREGTNSVNVHGGMILEVSKGKIRVVEQFNDPG